MDHPSPELGAGEGGTAWKGTEASGTDPCLAGVVRVMLTERLFVFHRPELLKLVVLGGGKILRRSERFSERLKIWRMQGTFFIKITPARCARI